MSGEIQLGAHALEYASRGWHVFPLHGVNIDGSCTCSNSTTCDKPGKHPRTRTGLKEATIDEVQIAKWWKKWPDANIGIRTGAISNLAVLDIDADSGGFGSWEDMQVENAAVEGCRVSTGGGGEHIYFTHPGAEIRNRNHMRPGIDFRGDGGYVIAPPSAHVSGKRYDWRTEWDASGESYEDVQLPGWLEDEVRDITEHVDPDLGEFSAEVKDWDGKIPQEVEVALEAGTDKLRKAFRRDKRLKSEGADASKVDLHIACALYELGVSDARVLAFGIMSSRSCDAEAWATVRRKTKTYFADTAALAIRKVEEQRAEHRRVEKESHAAWSEAFLQTELGDAERFVKIHGSDLAYHATDKAWLVWDGARFVGNDDVRPAGELAVEGRVFGYLRDMARLLPKLMASGQDEWFKHALKAQKAGYLSAMKTLVRNQVAVSESQLDADPMQLNCQNGVLDLGTGKLLDHSRRRRITMVTGARYMPRVRSQLWEDFLKTVIPDDDTREFFQTVAGYSILGSQNEQVFAFIHGPGGTGKSVLMKAYGATLGNYHRSSDFSTFLLQRGNQSPQSASSHLARLSRARAVSAVEVGHGQALDAGRIKQLSGGDPVTSRPLFGTETEWNPVMVLWLVANDRPTARVEDDALWERLLPFELARKFRGTEEQDSRLAEKLTHPAQRIGILTWLVEGCQRYLKDGKLHRPASIMEGVKDYIDHSNPLRGFLDECVEADPMTRTERGAAWDRYRTWCEENRQRTMGKITFFDLVDRDFPVTRRADGRYFKGLRLVVSK